jgi:hypothetical protein
MPTITGTRTEAQLPLNLNFKKICDEAVEVADTLIDRLHQAKTDGIHRPWSSFQHAIKSAWSRKEIDALLKRMNALRETLDTHVLFSLRYV